MRLLRSERGYTLIESIGFLGVVAMLAVGILMMIGRMIDRYKLSRVGNQIQDLQKNIDYRFSSAESFSDLAENLLIKEKLVPSDMVVGNKLYHAYSGEAFVKPSRGGFAYTVEFDDLPMAACIELATLDWSTGHTSHLVSMRVNGTYYDWKGVTNELPILLNDAQDLCTGDYGGNNILWQFQ